MPFPSSNDPPNSPYFYLLLEASRFNELSTRTEVTDGYYRFRELLREVAETSGDFTLYTHSWTFVNLHGAIELLDYNTGNDNALFRLQRLIHESISCLP